MNTIALHRSNPMNEKVSTITTKYKPRLVYRVVHLYDGHEWLVRLLQLSTDDRG
jgi:hypothetical protein